MDTNYPRHLGALTDWHRPGGGSLGSGPKHPVPLAFVPLTLGPSHSSCQRMAEEEVDFVAVTVVTSRASETGRRWAPFLFLQRRCQCGTMVEVVRSSGGFQEGEPDKSSLHLKPRSVFPRRGPEEVQLACEKRSVVWNPLSWHGCLWSIITKETWLIK